LGGGGGNRSLGFNTKNYITTCLKLDRPDVEEVKYVSKEMLMILITSYCSLTDCCLFFSFFIFIQSRLINAARKKNIESVKHISAYGYHDFDFQFLSEVFPGLLQQVKSFLKFCKLTVTTATSVRISDFLNDEAQQF
jgi:hypothetical protein